MTNEQLKIMLMGLYAELGAAIEESRADVRASLDRKPVRARVHNSAPPLALCNMQGDCPNPEHWSEVEQDAPIPELQPLEAFQALLWDRIEMLT